MTEYHDLKKLSNEVSKMSHALNERMVKFLADLVRIRSYTGHEGPAVERTLKEFEAIGCDEIWMDTAGNALGRIGLGKHTILYDAHLDTNEVADEREWPHPPLEPVIKDGVMWGLGTSDCKGGVAAITYGAAILKALNLTEDFSLFIMGATLEEDAEGFALRSLIERDGLQPDAVLICEASDLTLRVGQRGRCEIRIRTTGKAAHASHPELGENAIEKMIPIIQALKKMEGSLPVHPVFGRGNQVISLIHGPNTPNSVPSWCEITLDRRIVPGENIESLLSEIRPVVEPLGGNVYIPDQSVITHNGQNLSGPSFYSAFMLDDDSNLLTAAQETCKSLFGKPAKTDVWKFSTDGCYSGGIANIPTIGYGPQEAKYCHTPDDQINLEKTRLAAMFYAFFPMIYCATMNGK